MPLYEAVSAELLGWNYGRRAFGRCSSLPELECSGLVGCNELGHKGECFDAQMGLQSVRVELFNTSIEQILGSPSPELLPFNV